MAIQTGDRIPSATVHLMGEKGPQAVDSTSLFEGRKVVLFAVPGAFTPGCSNTHLPGYVVHVDAIKAKGVDAVICMAVNDAFVMRAWGEAQNAEHLVMLADGNADFTRALGLELDASGYGMGIRSQRFALIVDDGVVTHVALEPAGGIDRSSAEAILEVL